MKRLAIVAGAALVGISLFVLAILAVSWAQSLS